MTDRPQKIYRIDAHKRKNIYKKESEFTFITAEKIHVSPIPSLMDSQTDGLKSSFATTNTLATFSRFNFQNSLILNCTERTSGL